MYPNRKYLFCCLLGLALVSCLDPIELDIPSGGVANIAVDGKLVFGNPSTLVVSVSELFDFDGNPNRISVLRVELHDEENNSFEIRTQDRGFYRAEISESDPNIQISPDQKYKIKVFLASGDTVESDFQSLQRVPRNNSISQSLVMKTIEEDDGGINDVNAIRFISENQIPQDKDTKLKLEITRTYRFSNLNTGQAIFDMRWCQREGAGRGNHICDLLREDPSNPGGLYDCDRGGISNAVECDLGLNPADSTDDQNLTIIARSCYISGFEDINNLKLFDPATDQTGNTTFTQDLFEPLVDFRFAEGFYVQVITESINQVTFDYFKKIEEILSITGSMFDPPAGKITGNMINTTNTEATVYGYFYYTEQDTVNAFVERDAEIEDYFCLRDFSGMPPDACLDCTTLAGVRETVSVIRPSFWPDN